MDSGDDVEEIVLTFPGLNLAAEEEDEDEDEERRGVLALAFNDVSTETIGRGTANNRGSRHSVSSFCIHNNNNNNNNNIE